MTNTDTADVASTVQQCLELATAGSEMVRVTVNVPEAAAAVPEIKKRMLEAGCAAPLIGDFHYNGHVLLTKYPDCAKALDKYRINPGNVGAGQRRDDQFATICRVARDNGKPVRIGVTIRVSLTPRPGGDRREEVYAACELLQALGLRSFAPSVTACPGCGRTTSTTFQELAESIQNYIRNKMPEWKTQYDGVEDMTLAVMGCIVNGPGESKAANSGISLPGTGEAPRCPVYIDGKKYVTLEGTYDELSEAFQALVDNYIVTKYPLKSAVVTQVGGGIPRQQ